MEAVVLDFLDNLLEDDFNSTEIGKILAGVKFHFEEEFESIPPKRIKRSLKGIRKAMTKAADEKVLKALRRRSCKDVRIRKKGVVE